MVNIYSLIFFGNLKFFFFFFGYFFNFNILSFSKLFQLVLFMMWCGIYKQQQFKLEN